jgi:hypothetical protein
VDKKYVGKVIALPKDAHEALTKVQDELTAKLGFKPSLSETLVYLIKNRGGQAID